MRESFAQFMSDSIARNGARFTRRGLMLAATWRAAPELPGAGRILIATPEQRDADFARTVILLIDATQHAAMGLILNRPLRRRSGEQLLFAGGPIAQGTRSLLREATTPTARRLCHGVWLSDGAARDPGSRTYLGYTGWTAAQIRDEILRGHWRAIAGDASIVFDPDPATLWERTLTREK
jgi:putative transcriptional regulator